MGVLLFRLGFDTKAGSFLCIQQQRMTCCSTMQLSKPRCSSCVCQCVKGSWLRHLFPCCAMGTSIQRAARGGDGSSESVAAERVNGTSRYSTRCSMQLTRSSMWVIRSSLSMSLHATDILIYMRLTAMGCQAIAFGKSTSVSSVEPANIQGWLGRWLNHAHLHPFRPTQWPPRFHSIPCLRLVG